MRKDVKFRWLDGGKAAFLWIKERFKDGFMLVLFNPAKPCGMETDEADFVTAAVLSQVDDQAIFCPVAFLSKNMSPAKCNYKIYNKELLAIIRAFEEWEPELLRTDEPVKVQSDQMILEYFMSTKYLSRRQARWSKLLSQFNFQIVYSLGTKGTNLMP
jgi:hypothetical protein